MKSITEAGDLKGRYVVLRSSLNLPVQDGVVTNEYRLKKALPTLRYLHEAGAKTILIGHIQNKSPDETLMPVYDALTKYLPAHWGGSINGEACLDRRSLMADGDILMLENTRNDSREKKNDTTYAKEIASLGDLYVFDSFDVAHRDHASITGVAAVLPSYAGLTMLEEVQKLTAVMTPEHPSLFLLGGAKFDTKMPLVEKYLGEYDHVFVAGALMNDVFKAKGYEVGTSKLSDTDLSGTPFLDDPKLLMPVDVIAKGPDGDRTCAPTDVQPNEAMMDVGPETVAMLKSHIEQAKTILWNGPFGAYQMGYESGTVDTAMNVAASPAFSAIGGGDTVAAVEKLGINDKFSHVSIGGGAMLKFLEEGTLPAIEALS